MKPEYETEYGTNVHHTKAIVITDDNINDSHSLEIIKFIYVGSHNMSAGAWGTRSVTGVSYDILELGTNSFFRRKMTSK